MGLFSFIGKIIGAREERKGIERGQDIQKAFEEKQLALTERLLAEGKPLREARQEAALATIPLLEEDILAEPGESPLFRRGLETGTRELFRSLAPFGLTESSVAGEAAGELTSGLLAREFSDIRNRRFALAGIGGTGRELIPSAVGIFGQAGTTSAGIARGEVAKGEVRGGLFRDLGEELEEPARKASQFFFPSPTPTI